MAATATQIFQNLDGNNNDDVNREELQHAISKAVELRALHAALIHGNSPSNLKFPLSSPNSQFSAQDYPVFTPSYEDEAIPGNHNTVPKSRTLSETWSDYGIEGPNIYETVLSDFKTKENPCCPSQDQKSVTEFYKSSTRTSLTDFKSLSSYNRCKPVTPDSLSSLQAQPKTKGIISRFFPSLKRKNKNNENLFSPNRTESGEVSQVFKDLGILSIETLKRELSAANDKRDAALMEVAEMKSSIGELRRKLEHLEGYCEELKKALKQAKVSNFTAKNSDGKGENGIPVTEEVMVEGFLQIVSEARLSVKQFCKTLFEQIEQNEMDNLNSLLQPYKLSLNYSKYSKPVLYHLEGIINQTLYQDFENPVFQKNGSPFHLDPQKNCQAKFASFVSLRNLSWNEVLRKGTKYYSEEFSKFCDQKMSCIITTLNWTRPWSEQLLQAFFVAAKCIWLLHLLAFSFSPPLGILRVEENRNFDSNYMEDMLSNRGRLEGLSRVTIMVMPGFYVRDRVLRCKVLCRFKSST